MGKPVEVRVLSRAELGFLATGLYPEVKTIGKPPTSIILLDYLRAPFLRAAQRAFINCESLLRPAGVSPPFFAEGAFFVPAVFLLAAQRAFISSESFRRPAAVSAPFFLAGAAFVPPFNLAQRALAAAESFARVEGEK
jgi:hypothetical protein